MARVGVDYVIPKELISVFEVLWQTAMEHAHNQLAEYKQSAALEQETVTKQKINIDLAIVNDRLIKHDEALAEQKKQYEDRLKRVYEEKDNLITACHHLKNEISKLKDANHAASQSVIVNLKRERQLKAIKKSASKS